MKTHHKGQRNTQAGYIPPLWRWPRLLALSVASLYPVCRNACQSKRQLFWHRWHWQTDRWWQAGSEFQATAEPSRTQRLAVVGSAWVRRRSVVFWSCAQSAAKRHKMVTNRIWFPFMLKQITTDAGYCNKPPEFFVVVQLKVVIPEKHTHIHTHAHVHTHIHAKQENPAKNGTTRPEHFVFSLPSMTTTCSNKKQIELCNSKLNARASDVSFV